MTVEQEKKIADYKDRLIAAIIKVMPHDTNTRRIVIKAINKVDYGL